MAEPEAVDAVGRRELASPDDIRLRERPGDLVVDDAFDFIGGDLQRDLLRNRLTFGRCLVDRFTDLALTTAVELERSRSEAANNEVSVAIGGAIEIRIDRKSVVEGRR